MSTLLRFHKYLKVLLLELSSLKFRFALLDENSPWQSLERKIKRVRLKFFFVLSGSFEQLIILGYTAKN